MFTGHLPPGGRRCAKEAAEKREAYEQGLRLTWDHDHDFDPLPGEIAAARCWRPSRGFGC
jgi:hypothetical protein